MSNRKCATSCWGDTSSFTMVVGIHLESRNHIWYFLSFLFLHMVLLIERYLCIDLVTKYSELEEGKKATMMPPRDYSSWEGAIVLRAAGLRVDVTQSP